MFIFFYKQKIFYSLAQGVSHLGRCRLQTESFQNIAIPVPPLQEQQAIANFLDRETAHIDALIAKKESSIELLKEKRQATITHAVTKGLNPQAKMKDSDIEWVGEVPEGWENIKLNQCFYIIDGDRGKEYPNEKDLLDNGIPFLSSSCLGSHFVNLQFSKYISENKFLKLGKGKLKPKDIIMSVRGTIGSTSIFMGNKGFINAQMMIFRPKKNVNALFFLYTSKSKWWISLLSILAYGTAQMQLSNSILSDIRIPFPPLQEQQSIIDYLDAQCVKLDTLISKTQRSIELLKEKRSALITAAVTGKIDVREAVC